MAPPLCCGVRGCHALFSLTVGLGLGFVVRQRSRAIYAQRLRIFHPSLYLRLCKFVQFVCKAG
jgi:hypothetical protein